MITPPEVGGPVTSWVFYAALKAWIRMHELIAALLDFLFGGFAVSD